MIVTSEDDPNDDTKLILGLFGWPRERTNSESWIGKSTGLPTADAKRANEHYLNVGGLVYEALGLGRDSVRRVFDQTAHITVPWTGPKLRKATAQ